jgi:hypothetical protein
MSLTSIDLPSSLTSIGNYFLSNCPVLKYIDLSGLTSLTTIGNYFLSNCTSLTSIDLSDLTAITSIGNYFIIYCYALTSVTVGDNDFSRNTLTIDSNSMNGVTNLDTNKIIGAKAQEFKTRIGSPISN